MFRCVITMLLLFCSIGPRADASDSRDLFEFRSDPWVNLHYFLYHEARNTLRGDERLRSRVRTYAEDQGVAPSDDDKAAWDQALAVYASYGDRHLIFDSELLAIGNTVMAGPEVFPTGDDGEPAYQALKTAMPIYQRLWWPRHDQANRARINELQGYLDQYGEAMATRMASAYGADWPAEPIRVDVSNYSGRHGAFATGNPNHIVLASRPNWFPGLQGLDVLFHEAGHTLPFEEQVLPRSRAAAKAAGIDEGGVWHAFLFYVPSRAAREVLPESHTPYAYFQDGPLAQGGMSEAEPFIRQALQRSADLDEVFEDIHRARSAAAGPSDQ